MDLSIYIVNLVDYVLGHFLNILIIFDFGEQKREYQENKVLRFFKNFTNIFVVFMVVVRFFSYFRIVKVFSKEVGLVTLTTKKMFWFLLVIAYFYVCFSVMSQMVNIRGSVSGTFISMYVWGILAGTEAEHFEEFPYAEVIIILGTVFITIVLLNILIAYLSNVFSRLEEEQEINLIREKAAMILDVETIVYFFKHVLRRKKQSRKKDLYNDASHRELVTRGLDELKVGSR